MLHDASGTKLHALCSAADHFLHLLPNVHLGLCRRAQRQTAPVRLLSPQPIFMICSEIVDFLSWQMYCRENRMTRCKSRPCTCNIETRSTLLQSQSANCLQDACVGAFSASIPCARYGPHRPHTAHTLPRPHGAHIPYTRNLLQYLESACFCSI